ncbi:MAG: short-chain dehydrogenase, partial [Sphingobium sp.]|nr:short-chain dehydrogenase [Sphingobium sp.]
MSAPAVLVTGGARRLGAVIARRLADDGWRIVVHYHHAAGEAVALARALGQDAVAIGQDLGVADAGDTLLLRAREALGGPVTAVINNASLFDYDTPPDVPANALSQHHAVNLAAPVLLANALARQDDLPCGSVVNILDQKIANLNPDFFAYSCAKVALTGATAMLDQALGPRIAVNAVAPGL